MYAWIWRKLPFGVPGKIVGSLALIAATGALLWYVVFPWAEPLLPFDDLQVTQDIDEQRIAEKYWELAGGESDEDQVDEDDNSVPYPTDANNPEPTATR